MVHFKIIYIFQAKKVHEIFTYTVKDMASSKYR